MLHTVTGCQLLEEGNVVMTDNIYNRMYRLNIKVVYPKVAATALAATSVVSCGIRTTVASTQTLDVWHRRLAHLNHATI